MIFNQQQRPEAIAISEQGKNAIIAEMQEAIKLLNKPSITTDDLLASVNKTRFVRNLMNLYLRDAFDAPLSTDFFEQPNPMGPFGNMYQQPMPPQYPGQRMPFGGMGMGYNVDPLQQMYNNVMGGQTYQAPPHQQRTTPQPQIRWADFGADKLIYSTVVPVPNVAPGVHTLIIRIADKPAPGAQLTPAAELDMYARTIRIFNHDEVLTADRLSIDGIKGMLEELTYEYIIGDKPFPHFSNEGMLLWNAVKQQPDQYYNWKVLNNRGEELTTIQLDHKDEA